MKRDTDLIRAILLEIEAQEEAFAGSALVIEGWTSAEIAYHYRLLHEAGFINARPLPGGTFHIIGMTFAGHDYLDAVRKPRIWHLVKDKASQYGVSLTFDLIKELAIALTREQLKL